MNRFLPFAILILMTASCSREKTIFAAAGGQPAASAEKVETLAASPIVDTYRSSGTVRARYTGCHRSEDRGQYHRDPRPGGRPRDSRPKRSSCWTAVTSRRTFAAPRRPAPKPTAPSPRPKTPSRPPTPTSNLARVTHKRFEDLLAKASVSQQESDESQARFKSAGAALDMAVSKRRQAVARRSQAEAELDAARVALGYATLSAPFAGLVTERRADPGSVATPGAPLLTVEREGNLRLETSIDESRLGLVRIGEQVEVEIGGLNRTVRGRVAETVPSIDAATRSFTAKIDLPSVPGLRAGMFGRAAFRRSASARPCWFPNPRSSSAAKSGRCTSWKEIPRGCAWSRSARRATTGARFSPG